MKFTTAFSWPAVLALATVVNAQRSFIGAPHVSTQLHKGQDFVIQIVRPNSIQGSTEVGIALSFQHCKGVDDCPNSTQSVGTVLYAGPYDPQIHEIPGNPYQNFTVQIPADSAVESGHGQIISTRLHLIGAGPSPTLETNIVDVNLA